jgi:16S rRNA (cytosine1402-N4)-methyltransferase
MHETVLLQQAVAALNIRSQGTYIDGTFGRGGHSRYLLAQLSEQAKLLVFDKDQQAITVAEQLAQQDGRVMVNHASFAQMKQGVEQAGLLGKVDGILLDLGVSSPQLDQAERGFSFLRDGPLDMRMNQEAGQTVAQWLNNAELRDIRHVLHVYGEEKFAALIAKHIVEQRQKKPFERTLQLAQLISDVIPAKAQEKGKHPATRSFQALRIFINGELDDLQQVLNDSVAMLAEGGRLVVISFHSLEDRIVKHFIREQEKGPELPRHIPVQAISRDPHLKSVGKAIKADEAEVAANVRSRSAVMRIAEKVMA